MKRTHIFLLMLIGIAVAYIVSVSGNYSTYSGFEKAALNPEQIFQVVGQLNKDKETYYEPEKDPNYFAFFLVDREGLENKVVYKGPPPPDFERSEDVVLNGHMNGDDFIATKILLKCPSKYEDGSLKEGEYEMKEYVTKA